MTDSSAHVSLVFHSVEPIWSPDARVLVLGTMPSPKSREVGIPYGHPQNRFWPVLAALFNDQDPKTPEGRRALARAHQLPFSTCSRAATLRAPRMPPFATRCLRISPRSLQARKSATLCSRVPRPCVFTNAFSPRKSACRTRASPPPAPPTPAGNYPISSRHTGRSSSGRKADCARNVLRLTHAELQYWGWCLGFFR